MGQMQIFTASTTQDTPMNMEKKGLIRALEGLLGLDTHPISGRNYTTQDHWITWIIRLWGKYRLSRVLQGGSRFHF